MYLLQHNSCCLCFEGRSVMNYISAVLTAVVVVLVVVVVVVVAVVVVYLI